MEELNIVNGSRPPEIHTIIAWNATDDKAKTIQYMNDIIKKKMNILYSEEIALSAREEKVLSNMVYYCNHSRVKNGSIFLIIVEDTNPVYSYEKATSCWQVLNKNMKIIKEDMRIKIGGSIRSYGSIHTSYNQEEALSVLMSLGLSNYYKRPNFSNFSEFFSFLNNQTNLKYLIQRSFHEIENGPIFFRGGKDIDILVNDYYYFKSLTGARTNNRRYMRENDNGHHVQSTISIGNVEVPFDIRYIGDNYVDSVWENNMLQKRIKHTLKNNIVISIPNQIDEMFSLIYNIIIQKPNPEKSKHIPRVNELLHKNKYMGVDRLNFNDLKSIRNLLDLFMKNNQYKYKRPHDKSDGFRV